MRYDADANRAHSGSKVFNDQLTFSVEIPDIPGGVTLIQIDPLAHLPDRPEAGRDLIQSRKHWFAVIDGCPVDLWDWFNQVREVADFDTGEIFNLIGWDHKAYKVWECPPLKG